MEKEVKLVSVSMVEETLVESDEMPANSGVRDCRRGSWRVYVWKLSLRQIPASCYVVGERDELVGFDPMNYEAHLANIVSAKNIIVGYKGCGPSDQARDSHGFEDLGSAPLILARIRQVSNRSPTKAVLIKKMLGFLILHKLRVQITTMRECVSNSRYSSGGGRGSSRAAQHQPHLNLREEDENLEPKLHLAKCKATQPITLLQNQQAPAGRFALDFVSPSKSFIEYHAFLELRFLVFMMTSFNSKYSLVYLAEKCAQIQPHSLSHLESSILTQNLLHSEPFVRAFVDECEEVVPLEVVFPIETRKQTKTDRVEDNEVSEESLYRINENASGWLLLRDGAGKGCISEDVFSVVNSIASCDGARNINEGFCVDSLDSNVKDVEPELNNETVDEEDPIRSDTEAKVNIAAGSDSLFGFVFRHGEEEFDDIEASDEEHSHSEAVEVRKVWVKGGISFYRSNEEEVLTRLAECKIVGKGRVDLRQKKHKQERKAPCLEGGTLAKRTL
ncbi:hypothetical protein PIB30_079968, partial [Stylosanthes scabra]|nr:hypothetical protein [Stylosanthes scabra]